MSRNREDEEAAGLPAPGVMADAVTDNPILISPFREPNRLFVRRARTASYVFGELRIGSHRRYQDGA